MGIHGRRHRDALVNHDDELKRQRDRIVERLYATEFNAVVGNRIEEKEKGLRKKRGEEEKEEKEKKRKKNIVKIFSCL